MSYLMLQHSPVRWKEWIPLITQQQRFRNLVQIIGYNIGVGENSMSKLSKEVSYYYTLHLSTMCAPFYTSEKISNVHPKWSEISFQSIDPSYGSVTGVVIRIWEHYKDADSIVTVWGVYFSGLANVDQHIKPQERSAANIDQHNLPQGRLAFTSNTLVLCMHGGYFTSSDCLLEEQPLSARISAMSMNQNEVRKSYSVETLCELHSIQRSMKESTQKAAELHNEILLGEFSDENSLIKENSAFLRKLLSQTRPTKVSHEQVLAVKRDIEAKKFRIQLLQELHAYKSAEVKKRTFHRNNLLETNQEEGSKLMSRYHTLSKDVERLKEWRKAFLEGGENLLLVKTQFSYRQRQLISELTYIYPVKRTAENKYTICDIPLPNSENFDGVDETSLSIALGFTAHLVQMISFIINIPLRYPIIHCGSRSKIVDHITDQIPDKDREFPLFTRGRDKLQFNYAVYLLNKNIAQLRWYCGISTTDLRTTLPNLETLLNLHCNNQNAAKGDTQSNEISFTKLSSISRNTRYYNSIPNRFNYRKNDDRLSLSLDEGLDKLDEKNERIASSCIVSESCRDDGQSSDSIEHDYIHKDYVSTPPPLNSQQEENVSS